VPSGEVSTPSAMVMHVQSSALMVTYRASVQSRPDILSLPRR